MTTTYIALGSNVGDRLAHLKAALAALPPKVEVLEESNIYETAPWGYTDQAQFLNMAIRAETELKPNALLAYLKDIETRIGRTETFKNGPREIDLDILFYGNRVYSAGKLTIPHPKMHERAFVLVPLADIAFDHIHPGFKAPVSQLLTELPTKDFHGIQEFRPAR
jgi:2-amino-4-hydroxy-6-hydroxymethyldihydropteridine diphosphokinase